MTSPSSTRSPDLRWRRVRSAALTLFAVVAAFLAGRLSVPHARAQAHQAGGAPEPAAIPPPAEPPPWCTHGFRDDESATQTCVTADCNG
jgi:hypothetical protein